MEAAATPLLLLPLRPPPPPAPTAPPTDEADEAWAAFLSSPAPPRHPPLAATAPAPPLRLALGAAWRVPAAAGAAADPSYDAAPGYVSALLELPDGRLAAAYRDGCIRLWPPALVADGAAAVAHEPLQTLAGHSDAALCLAWLPGAQLLASGGADGVLRLWALPPWHGGRDGAAGGGASAVCVAALSAHATGVRCVLAMPRGGPVVTGGWDGALRLWRVTAGGGGGGGPLEPWAGCAVLGEAHAGGVAAAQALPPSAHDAPPMFASAGDDGSLRVWELPLGASAAGAPACVAHLTPPPAHGERPHCGGVLHLAVHSTTSSLAGDHCGEPPPPPPQQQQQQQYRVTTVHNDGCVHTWAAHMGGGGRWALAGSARVGRPSLPVGCGTVLHDGQLVLGCERGTLLLLASAPQTPPPPAPGAAPGPPAVEEQLRGGHAPFATVRALTAAAGGRALLSADDCGVIAVWVAVPVATAVHAS